MGQAWMILSGKGGVGKSMFVSSLGIELSGSLRECCCVDLDIGLRSLDILLNVQNKVVYDMTDVANKDCKLKYALINPEGYEKLALLPASQLGDPEQITSEQMERIIRKLKKRFEYVILDAPAGMGTVIQKTLPFVDHTIVVTTPDDLTIRDAERIITLVEENGKPRPMLLVNRVVPEWVSNGDMYSPQTVANTLDISLLGYIPDDPSIPFHLNKHTCFLDDDTPAKQAMDRITKRFLGDFVEMPSFAPKKRGFFEWLFGE